MATPFDAFISYSRSASGQLAVDLQNGVERFAKPWNRLRSLRIFRDDSSMSANTALWSTIEHGLTEAEWLILLATPTAAKSEYVNNEIAWWVERKGADRILLVHADGVLEWDRTASDFSVDTDAVPPSLRAAYREEPRWIDMRWYGDEGSLGREDPRFVERVADLSSAIRGVERDNLIGENVRQHRLARRLLRAGVVGLSALLVVSLVTTVVAVVQGNAATEQARISLARQLSATSLSLLETDAAKARLLAVYGYQLNADPQTRAALLAAVSSDKDLEQAVDVEGTISAIASTPDASSILIGSNEGTVWEWLPPSQPVELGRLPGEVVSLSISDDGSIAAASARDRDGSVSPSLLWVEGEPVALPEEASSPVKVSGDGAYVGVPTLPAGEIYDGLPRDSGFVLLDRDSGYSDGASTDFDEFPVDFAITEDRVVAWVDWVEDGHVVTRDLDLSVVNDIEAGPGRTRDQVGVLSRGGDYLVQVTRGGWAPYAALPNEVPVWSTQQDAGDLPARFGWAPDGAIDSVAISTDGTMFAASSSGVVYVTPAQSRLEGAVEPLELSGSGTVTTMAFAGNDMVVTGGGSRVAIRTVVATNPLQSNWPYIAKIPTAGADTRMPLQVRLSETGDRLVTVEQYGSLGAFANEHTSRTVGVEDPKTAPGVFLDWRDADSAFLLVGDQVMLAELDSGETTSLGSPLLPEEVPAEDFTYAPAESRFVFLPESNRLLLGLATGALSIDAASGAVADRWDLRSATFSPDGRYATGLREDGTSAGILNLASGEVHEPVTEGVGSYRGRFFVQSRDGVAIVSEPDGSTVIGEFPEPTFSPVTISPDGSIAAAVADDGTLTLRSINTGGILGTFETPGVGENVGLAFAGDGRTLVVAQSTNSFGDSYTIIDLDPTSWVDLLCVGQRDLDDDQWTRFAGTSRPANIGCHAD